MSDRFNNNDLLLRSVVEEMENAQKERNDIAEKSYLLQKAQAKNDMSIYDNYIKQKNAEDEAERGKRKAVFALIGLAGVVLLAAAGMFMFELNILFGMLMFAAAFGIAVCFVHYWFKQ